MRQNIKFSKSLSFIRVKGLLLKSVFSLLLAAIVVLSLMPPTVAAVINPAFAVRIVGTQDTVNGKSVVTVDWRIKATQAGLKLRGSSGLRLAYDNTVLQLVRFSGTGADYALTESLSGMPSAARPGGYEGAVLDVRACRNTDSTVGYVTIELGHQEYTYDCVQNEEATLVSIRFAFRDGKSQADLIDTSIRLMTIAEMEARYQPSAINISVASADHNTEYVYRSRTVEDSLNAPDIVLPITPPSGPAKPTDTHTQTQTQTQTQTPPDLPHNPTVQVEETPPMTTFDDIGSVPAWAKDAVEFVGARNLIVGLTGNMFEPAVYVTRGEFTATLLRAYGLELDPDANDNFSDVDNNAAYAPYIATAKKSGIVLGVGNNLFLPENQVTREEMFTLLHRTLVNIGKAPEDSPNGKKLSDFKDAGKVSGWAKEEIESLLKAGMIDGTGNNELSPKRLTDRATMARMIYNLLTR